MERNSRYWLGYFLLRNAKHAEFIHNEVPGMQVPERIRKQMHAAGSGRIPCPVDTRALAISVITRQETRIPGECVLYLARYTVS